MGNGRWQLRLFFAMQEGIREMEAKFVKYDLDFEYGCELPEIFLK